MKYTWERTLWQTMKKTISPVKGSEDAEETCVRNVVRMGCEMLQKTSIKARRGNHAPPNSQFHADSTSQGCQQEVGHSGRSGVKGKTAGENTHVEYFQNCPRMEDKSRAPTKKAQGHEEITELGGQKLKEDSCVA